MVAAMSAATIDPIAPLRGATRFGPISITSISLESAVEGDLISCRLSGAGFLRYIAAMPVCVPAIHGVMPRAFRKYERSTANQHGLAADGSSRDGRRHLHQGP